MEVVMQIFLSQQLNMNSVSCLRCRKNAMVILFQKRHEAFLKQELFYFFSLRHSLTSSKEELRFNRRIKFLKLLFLQKYTCIESQSTRSFSCRIQKKVSSVIFASKIYEFIVKWQCTRSVYKIGLAVSKFLKYCSMI